MSDLTQQALLSQKAQDLILIDGLTIEEVANRVCQKCGIIDDHPQHGGRLKGGRPGAHYDAGHLCQDCM
jgi:hypothetical protein